MTPTSRVGHLEVKLWHLEGRQVSWLGQSLMTSISGHQGQIDLKFGGKHRLVILHQHNKFIKIEDSHVNFTRLFFIDLTWNAPYVEICMINQYVTWDTFLLLDIHCVKFVNTFTNSTTIELQLLKK